MRFGSVATSVRKGDVASFAAVRAIIKAIHAKTNVKHALADSAVLVASALILGLVALNAEHRAGGHCNLLKKTLPDGVGLRQVQQGNEFVECGQRGTAFFQAAGIGGKKAKVRFTVSW